MWNLWGNFAATKRAAIRRTRLSRIPELSLNGRKRGSKMCIHRYCIIYGKFACSLTSVYERVVHIWIENWHCTLIIFWIIIINFHFCHLSIVAEYENFEASKGVWRMIIRISHFLVWLMRFAIVWLIIWVIIYDSSEVVSRKLKSHTRQFCSSKHETNNVPFPRKPTTES